MGKSNENCHDKFHFTLKLRIKAYFYYFQFRIIRRKGTITIKIEITLYVFYLKIEKKLNIPHETEQLENYILVCGYINFFYCK